MSMPLRVTAIAALALASVSAGHAQLVNENLLVRVPEGYKVDHQARNDKQLINEMVPQAETVKMWTEMVTVQIFFGLKRAPEDMRDSIAAGWLKACPDGTQQPVANTTENGYPTLIWLLTCPNNRATGWPEWTWFKAVGGNDSLYVVQKAFRFVPNNEQITTWMRYLKTVGVCDSRLADRACPKTN